MVSLYMGELERRGIYAQNNGNNGIFKRVYGNGSF